MSIRGLLKPFVVLGLLAAVGTAVAATEAKELPGAKDHPLVSRYNAAVPNNSANERFASLLLP
ncbi:MAG: hypothetical protein ABIN96_08375 [Rubrivivax sp.]